MAWSRAEAPPSERPSVEDRLRALGAAGIERLGVVGAHLGRLAGDAGDGRRGVLVGLVDYARADFGLKGHPRAFAELGVALQRGPLRAVAAHGEGLDRIR